MRKLMTVLTFALALLSISGVATAMDPPQCGDSCPFVR
jgi:hypothetical protein